MARIAGVTVSSVDARWLIEALRAFGRADDATAAHAIERAIRHLVPVDDLTPAERDAVVGCLGDPPLGLVPLRAALAKDLRSATRVRRVREPAREVGDHVGDKAPLPTAPFRCGKCDDEIVLADVVMTLLAEEATARIYACSCAHCGDEIGLIRKSMPAI